MRQLYKENTANFPRLLKDVFFADYNNYYSYNGFIDDCFKFVEDFQLKNPTLWRRFVQQFREDADFDGGWRGEYWGKMMRGASFVYAYTKDKELYDILTKTIEDMINSADEDGRISSYGKNHEFDAWDLWERKYVMLGMQYFLEICTDKSFSLKIIESMKKQADYIIARIGNKEDGKKPITKATRHWRGLNSSSILEPFVRLYSLTKQEKYLNFAKYIVDTGATDVVNIFHLALKNDFAPYQYPVTKAYEMTSCFEGLLEYYRITGEDWMKTSLVNYADKILETDFTVIGCSGCTHELFDHSTVRQTNTNNEKIMQETCVTVTLMKFFYQLNLLTGYSRYADAFEISLYNAYIGAFNTEKVIEPTIKENHPDWAIEPLPFDSYSPLTAGTRGNGIGGLKVMSDNHYYGCCACIGSCGIGLVPKIHILTSEKGFAVNLFINGIVKTTSPLNNSVTFKITTDYPKNGKIQIEINLEKDENFEILVRNPGWSDTTEIFVNNNKINVNDGYVAIEKLWQNGDTIEINLDMRAKVLRPIPYGTQILMSNVVWGSNYIIPVFDREDEIAKNHIAIRRGPVMLAQDNRLGYSVDNPVTIKVENEEAQFELTNGKAPYPCIFEGFVTLENGEKMLVTDYSSAGKLWTKESKMAVWMLTK